MTSPFLLARRKNPNEVDPNAQQVAQPMQRQEPEQIDPRSRWQKVRDQDQQEIEKRQSADAISPVANTIPQSEYMNRFAGIKAIGDISAAGQSASSEVQRQRAAQIAANKLAAAQAAAQADAYAASAGFQVPGASGMSGVPADNGAGWGGGGAQGVANVLRQAGFPEDLIPTFMAIAKAESSWNINATHKNSNGTIDQGLFQINSVHKGNPWYPTNPFDPLQSAIAAFNIYKQQGLRAWTVYQTGAYKQFLPTSVPPIQATSTGVLQSNSAAPGGQAAYNGGNYGPINTKGLAGNAAAARDFITKTWGITNIGGFGGGSVSTSDHPKGKALDVMIGNYKSAGGIAQGTTIANWFIANPRAYGVKYIIWRDRIWQDGVWKPYSHPSGNNDTLQHRDHVHISFL